MDNRPTEIHDEGIVSWKINSYDIVRTYEFVVSGMQDNAFVVTGMQ
jgi:hypothetical protein